MRVFVIKDYRCRGIYHPAGTILEVSPAEAAHLMVDAPGCFSLVESAKDKEMEQPPRDKMLRKGKSK